MKKCVIFLVLILFFYGYVSRKLVTIPSDSIRIRILPNSNSSYDQEIKLKVKNKLEVTLYDLLKDVQSVSEARDVINNNLSLVDRDVSNVLSKNGYELGYDIDFGYNYFPEKEFKGVKYDSGYYESLLVTLGKGDGDNYFCVLFPPLCLVDEEEVEYRSFISDVLEKYIH